MNIKKIMDELELTPKDVYKEARRLEIEAQQQDWNYSEVNPGSPLTRSVNCFGSDEEYEELEAWSRMLTRRIQNRLTKNYNSGHIRKPTAPDYETWKWPPRRSITKRTVLNETTLMRLCATTELMVSTSFTSWLTPRKIEPLVSERSTPRTQSLRVNIEKRKFKWAPGVWVGQRAIGEMCRRSSFYMDTVRTKPIYPNHIFGKLNSLPFFSEWTDHAGTDI